MKKYLALFLLAGCYHGSCDFDRSLEIEDKRQMAWRSNDCQDESVLVATTAGSPNGFTCPNHLHRMQVQVATHPSNEEAAALVFCQCQRDLDGGSE